jgi:hypothetical protein
VNRRIELPQLVAELQAWTRTHDAPVMAAVELLIGHDVWLRRAEFRSTCVPSDRRTGDVWISWSAAVEAFEAGSFDRCSSSERAVLDLAIALAIDRYRLRGMGTQNLRLVVAAVATGTQEVAR